MHNFSNIKASKYYLPISPSERKQRVLSLFYTLFSWAFLKKSLGRNPFYKDYVPKVFNLESFNST